MRVIGLNRYTEVYLHDPTGTYFHHVQYCMSQQRNAAVGVDMSEPDEVW